MTDLAARIADGRKKVVETKAWGSTTMRMEHDLFLAMAARIEELEKVLENTREPVQSWPPPVYRIHPKS
jgi:hypothetical protein